MLFDSHLHTTYSADSQMELDEACQRAAELGIGLVTTEHMDLLFEDERFTFDVNDYLRSYNKRRGAHLLLGIELGMQLKSAEMSRMLIEKHEFDYVIGSLHILFGVDMYLKACYAGRSRQEVYDAYFQTMLDNLKQHSYIDALAHIDFLCRYADFPQTDIIYSEQRERIDAVLQFLVEHDIVLEINARRLGDRQAVQHLQPIYQRYRELGGRYVTIGSDAHTPDSIASHFAQALELAEYNKLQPVYFKERQIRKC